MINFHQIYDLSDQPTTCPKCGTRTVILMELKLKTKGIQVHRCLGKNCTFEFSSEYSISKMIRDDFSKFNEKTHYLKFGKKEYSNLINTIVLQLKIMHSQDLEAVKQFYNYIALCRVCELKEAEKQEVLAAKL